MLLEKGIQFLLFYKRSHRTTRVYFSFGKVCLAGSVWSVQCFRFEAEKLVEGFGAQKRKCEWFGWLRTLR